MTASVGKIESEKHADLTGILTWFVLLRWIAIGGVTGAIVITRFASEYKLAYGPVVFVSALLLTCNTIYSYYFFVAKRSVLSPRQMTAFFHIQTIGDYLFLFLLVYFTGFVSNPFVYFFVFHIVLTSLIFPRRIVILYALSLIVVFAGTAIAVERNVLPFYSLFKLSLIDIERSEYLDIQTIALVVTLGIVGYLITSIKAKIEERGNRVELELDRYRSLDRAKSNFILQVTHELRGPVAAVKGYHEMILKGITGDITEKTAGMLGRADHRTRNLLNIIDEMIDFAYMKSEDEIEYDTMDIGLLDVLKYNADLFATMAKAKQIGIHVSAAKDLSVKANRDLLNMILGNLVTNAIKYSPESSRIDISAHLADEQVHISVTDQGMGIEQNDFEQVFEEFYRTRSAREIERDGTGLGLSIVQKAIGLLGGSLALNSEVGHGTTFHIRIPIKAQSGGQQDG